jgi:hypothetical protein
MCPRYEGKPADVPDEHHFGLANRVGRTSGFLKRRDEVAGYRPVGLGQSTAAEKRDDVQAQGVCIGVFSVSLDLVVPQEQRRVLTNRSSRTGGRIQSARGAARYLGGVPLRLLRNRERSLIGAERACRSVVAIRGLVHAAEADTLLALPALHICHGQPLGVG